MSEKTYLRRKSMGICVRCGRSQAAPGRVFCGECLDKERIKKAKLREWFKSMGLCPRCGKERLWGDEKHCPECLARAYATNLACAARAGEEGLRNVAQSNRKRYEKLKSMGICPGCRKPARPGKVYCKACAVKRAKRAMERRGIPRSERAGYGLCYFCGSPAQDGKRTCRECGAKMAANLPSGGGSEHWRRTNGMFFVKGKKGRNEGDREANDACGRERRLRAVRGEVQAEKDDR